MTQSHDRCPWNQPDAATWLNGNEAMRHFATLVTRTLENDARQFPLQMRAAAAIVILLARPGMWPGGSPEELDHVLLAARRNLSVIRELYSIDSKRRDDLGGKHGTSLHRLLKAIEYEMRILDARLSDEPLNIPNEPPEAWGLKWPKP